MIPKVIKKDILNVLSKAIVVLEKNDYEELRKLSNQTIHDAGIFQTGDPLTIAVAMYALSKLAQRLKEEDEPLPKVLPLFRQAYDYLKNSDENGYRASIKKILRLIVSKDEEIRVFTQEVMEKAKIKKGSKLHQHGISIARTAELLGISQWELQEYIGKFRGDSHDNSLHTRIAHARRLFK